LQVLFVLVGDIERGFGSPCPCRRRAKTTRWVVFRAWTYTEYWSCTWKEARDALATASAFCFGGKDIERGLCSRCSLKVFFDAQGASFCFAKTENSAEDLYKGKDLYLK